MSEERKLRVLEGLGYVAAVMIGAGGVAEDFKALKIFNVLGLVFAIIVIVRLMVMNISLGALPALGEGPFEAIEMGLDDEEMADED